MQHGLEITSSRQMHVKVHFRPLPDFAVAAFILSVLATLLATHTELTKYRTRMQTA
jgi:hypothetical protein